MTASTSSTLDSVEISPVPTEEEAAAIAAAVQLLWPTAPSATAQANDPVNDAAWRFSRRWWEGGSRSATWGTQPH